MKLIDEKWIEMPTDIVTGHHQLQQMLVEGAWEELNHGYSAMAYNCGCPTPSRTGAGLVLRVVEEKKPQFPSHFRVSVPFVSR